MNKIYKYPLQVTDTQVISIPSGAQLLSVQSQYGQICLWALIDDEALGWQLRTINVYGTGNPLPIDPGVFLGTVQTSDGALVWHVFEGAQ